MHTTVPIIDIAPFIGGSARGKAAVAAVVGRACADIGFFTIVGHGVSESLVARMFDVSRAFFDLPLEDKLRAGRPRPEQSRGYIGVGDENLAYSLGAAGATDLKEFFAIGPPEVPDEEYYRAMEDLAATVMRIFALALDLPERFFADKTDRHISGLRVVHYPDQPSLPLASQSRAGAHTDYGAVTILRSDDAPGGLEVLSRRGQWAAVAPAPGAFVLNIGDLMMRWTNDRWVSTLHRVANPPPESGACSRRLSLVFFHQPNYDAVIECLPTCTSAANPPRYAPVTSGQHRLAKFLKGVGAAPQPA